MARISDHEGSKFDAPLETLWKYLRDPTAHGEAHKSARNRSMQPLTETSFVVSWEQNMNGNWVKVSNRITVFPPLGSVSEAIEGPLAGSKTFTVYTARGAQTEVAVFGEMRSSAVPEEQLEAAVRAAWANAFEEDSVAIREYAKRSK
jgi:hypothetical protein